MPFSKLRGRIREIYGSERNLAKKMGISNQVLNKKLNGITRMTAEDIQLFCNLLYIPANEIPDYFFIYNVSF